MVLRINLLASLSSFSIVSFPSSRLDLCAVGFVKCYSQRNYTSETFFLLSDYQFFTVCIYGLFFSFYYRIYVPSNHNGKIWVISIDYVHTHSVVSWLFFFLTLQLLWKRFWNSISFIAVVYESKRNQFIAFLHCPPLTQIMIWNYVCMIV